MDIYSIIQKIKKLVDLESLGWIPKLKILNVETAEKIISFAEDANKTFSGPSLQTKKTILSALGSNLILKDKILHVDTDSALLPMKLVSFPSIQKIQRLEPAVVAINKGRTQVYDQVRPMWLGLLPDVRTAVR